MNLRHHPKFFSILIILIFAFSLVTPSTAIAEGETPPGWGPGGGTPVDDGGPDGGIPQALPGGVSGEEAGPTLAATIMQIDSTILVAGADGELLPLASQEAAEVLGDPQFCSFTLNGALVFCGARRLTITEALADSYAYNWNGTEAGSVMVIRINSGTYVESAVVDPLNFGTNGVPTAMFLRGIDNLGTGVFVTGALTIQNFGSETQDFAFRAVDFSVTSLTLQHIIAHNEGFTTNSSDWYDTGVYIDLDAGIVTLDDVHANSNEGQGAEIETVGNVSILDSQFNANDGLGLHIDNVNGNITIDGTEVKENDGYGTEIYSYWYDTLPIRTISITDSDFSSNHDDGLDIYGSANVTINNLVSDFNEGEYYADGANIYIGGYDDSVNDVLPITPYYMVTITNSSFSDNDDNGLEVFTPGSILLDNVLVNRNGTSRSILNTTASGGDNNVQPFIPRSVTVLNSQFNGTRESAGLDINSYGPVLVEGSTFDGNAGYGLDVYLGSNNIAPTGDVIEVEMLSPITIRNVSASGNDEYGISAKIENQIFNSSEVGVGIELPEFYWITLDGVTANSNGSHGAIVGLMMGGPILIENSTFNGNGGYGIMAVPPMATPSVPNGNGYGYLTEITVKNTTACWNVLGPIGEGIDGPVDEETLPPASGVEWTFQNFTTVCDQGGGLPPADGLPGQVLIVFTDPGFGSTVMDPSRSLTIYLMEQKDDPEVDLELVRVVLSPFSIPSGTTVKLEQVGEGTPAPLGDGSTYVGPTFTITATTSGGEKLDGLTNLMEIRFKLAEGFTVPAGKKLEIQWYNPATSEWVGLATYVGGGYATAYSSQTGSYTLALVDE